MSCFCCYAEGELVSSALFSDSICKQCVSNIMLSGAQDDQLKFISDIIAVIIQSQKF